jgi:hypothetical protein
MARLPRLIVPFQPHYVIQRGLNGLAVFQDAADYTYFLGWLRSPRDRTRWRSTPMRCCRTSCICW